MKLVFAADDPAAIAWTLGGVLFWIVVFLLVRALYRFYVRTLKGPWESLTSWLSLLIRRAESLTRGPRRLATRKVGQILQRVRRRIRAWRRRPRFARTPKGVKAAVPKIALGFHFDPSAEEIVGQTTWWLVTNPERWVNRLVESIVFLDDVSVRRQMSVDFTLPVNQELVRSTPTSGDVFVPLALLEKKSLTRFDIRDESGDALPLLGAHQNGEVAGACLVAFASLLARNAGYAALPAGIRRDLYVAASSNGDVAERAVVRLREGRGPAAVLRRDLMADKVFNGLVEEFKRHFLVLVACPYDGTTTPPRRLLKFGYDEHRLRQRPPWFQLRFWQRPLRYVRNALERLSLKAHRYSFGRLPVGRGVSFHFEVEAPEDLVIAYAEMEARAPGDPKYFIRDRVRGPVRRAHLHLADAPLQAVANTYVWLRVQKRGLLWAAAIASTVAAVLLQVGVRHLSTITGSPAPTTVGSREAAAALLLLLPTLVIANLGRPGEHQMASWLVFGTRLLLLTVGLCLVWASATLAFGFAGPHLHDWWQDCAWVATGAAVVLILGTISPARPIRKTTERPGRRR
jgi:hypothetical protein